MNAHEDFQNAELEGIKDTLGIIRKVVERLDDVPGRLDEINKRLDAEASASEKRRKTQDDHGDRLAHLESQYSDLYGEMVKIRDLVATFEKSEKSEKPKRFSILNLTSMNWRKVIVVIGLLSLILVVFPTISLVAGTLFVLVAVDILQPHEVLGWF